MEKIEASTSDKGLDMHAAMVPAGTQTSPFLKRKVPHQRKEGVTDVPEGPTVTTRLMQKKKDLTPPKPPPKLPDLSSLSGLLVQAINSCKSDNGINFPELKKMLSGQGYDVTKRCPRMKKKLHTLSPKGALVRMTNSDGSTLFVIRKYPEKIVAPRIFEGSKQTDETKQEGVEGRKKAGNSAAKTKGAARQARSPGWKSGEANGRLQSLDKKLKPGKKQQQPNSKSRSAKVSQGLVKKAISTTRSQRHHSGIRDIPTPQSPCHSSDNAAATPMILRNLRSRTTSAAKKLPSSASLIPTRSRLSASNIKLAASVKRRESPYSKETLLGKKPRHCKSKTALPSEGQRCLRKKSTTSLPDHRPSAMEQPVLKSKRRL